MNDITGLVLTFNEAPNIARTLGKLSWLPRVIVLDSHSTDTTAQIAATFANVQVIARPFTSHQDQWNFGIEQAGITSEWVLALDADYLLSDEAIREIQALIPAAETAGYSAAFTYCIDGYPLRGAAYPPVTVLYRRARARYVQDGHTQRVRVEGLVVPLLSRILHDDRKSLTHWLGAQAKYMRLEAHKLANATPGSLGFTDQLRRWIVVAPPAMFVYCYVFRGGILDGKAGLFYALQRAASELILSLFLVRHMLGADPHG